MSGMGIKLKKEKCLFMKPTVEYFAFVVETRRLVRFKPFQVHENPKELKSFLGIITEYLFQTWRLKLTLLNDLLAENILWQWAKQCQEAF